MGRELCRYGQGVEPITRYPRGLTEEKRGDEEVKIHVKRSLYKGYGLQYMQSFSRYIQKRRKYRSRCSLFPSLPPSPEFHVSLNSATPRITVPQGGKEEAGEKEVC